MTRVRVVLLESHEVARRGVAEMLAALPQVELAGAVATVEAAAALVEPGVQPQVLILDSDVDRRQAAALLDRIEAGLVVMALVRSLEPAHLAAAIDLRPNGFILEEGLTTAILEAIIDQLLAGEVPIPAALVRHLLSAPARPTAGVLTAREHQVLQLLVEGLSNKQIGRRLGITMDGAKHHVGRILTKLHCPNRASAIAHILAHPVPR